MRVRALTLALCFGAAACGGGAGSGGTGGSGAGGGGAGGGGAGSGGAGSGGAAGANSAGGGGGHSGTGGAAGKDGGVDANSPGDGGTLCPVPPAGIPDGGARCAVSCDPRPDGGGVCYGFPLYNAATTTVELWVADAAAPQGGWRVTLVGSVPVTVGGHTYLDQLDGLVGTGGNGIYGDIYVARDGQAKWVGFHFEGFAAYQGGGVWDWPATMTVSGATGSTPATFGRHYTITRSGPCPLTSAGTYTFVADDPPRACASGWAVDLLSFTQPGA